MTAALMSAHGLGKAFPVANDPRERLAALLRVLLGKPLLQRWAVQGVSFEIRPGESLGVIGENGAGKSTLLKLLVGVLTPSAGTLQRTGSIGALLELGAGFDLERSGRENIALSSGLMGWSPAQVREREAEIIAFADIGEHIDAPVKHYSSGMVVRLGFAIIAAVRPALLITDEVLAVGDESFQKKCIRWIESYLDGGGTLLLVSHSMYHIQKLCKSALWMRDGRVEAYGDVFDVTQDYLAFHERKAEAERGAPEVAADYQGEQFKIVSVKLNDEFGELPRVLPVNGELLVEVDLYTPDGRFPHLGFGIVRADGTAVFGSTSEIAGVQGEPVAPQRVRFRLQLQLGGLLPGQYGLNLHALDSEALRLFDTVSRGLIVRGQSREFGLVNLPHRWL